MKMYLNHKDIVKSLLNDGDIIISINNQEHDFLTIKF